MLNRVIPSCRTIQRGFGLIELMVGITIGMIVVAGATILMTNQVTEHRRLMLETQVQQDLRAVGDLILRDLRRSGYWAVPQNGIWAPEVNGVSPTIAANAYSAVTVGTVNSESKIQYSYSRSKSDNEINVLSNATVFGFKLEGDTLKFLLGNSWQPLTDNGTLIVTDFDITLNTQIVSLADTCENPCPGGGTACMPVQEVRNVTMLLRGHATHDPAVDRTVRTTSRLRNDRIVGACPAAA